MLKAKYLLTTLAGLLGFAALTPDASAITFARCDSSVWFNDQDCLFDSTQVRSKTITSSNAALTAHSITISLPVTKTGVSATAVALDGSGRVIAGSSITTTGSAQPRAFSTAASNPPRRLQTTIDHPTILVGARATARDVWPSFLNVRTFDRTTGAVNGRCVVSGSSTSTTSHSISSNLYTGTGCSGVALNSAGSFILALDDFSTGGSPTSLTFTTTASGRPRRVEATTLH